MSPLLNADLFWSALPDIGLLRYAYVRKAAVLSAEIEGTQWSPPDLLMFEGGKFGVYRPRTFTRSPAR